MYNYYMIQLTRLNKTVLYVNEDLIETIEETPNTVITFFSGRKLIVKENINTIINLIHEYRNILRRE